MDVAEARRQLSLAGVSPRDVHLPGEEPVIPRQGVVVVRSTDEGVEVVSEEYGLQETLTTTRDQGEALDYVVDRLTRPLPALRPVDLGLVQRTREVMAGFVSSVKSSLASAPVELGRATLWDGAVVDRFGTLDGFLLWPEGVPYAERSLPPDAMDKRFPQYGRVVLGCATEIPVVARVTAPWFGQPGGAVVMRLEPGLTVRDLLADGRMLLLDVPD